MDAQGLDGGFADPVMQSQHGFHALMHALANPGTIHDLALDLTPPGPLSPELAAVALTLCDHDTNLWLDPALATDAVTTWLGFHTGAPLSNKDRSAFALCTTGTADFSQFNQGTDLYPDRSTTVVLPVVALAGGEGLILKGPGIDGATTMAPVGLPADFLAQWADNAAPFPRGIDLLLVCDGQVIGLPRTTRIAREEA